MARGPLRTSEVAQAVGVHPNTVRLYEEWGFLPPVPRSTSGYRQFTPRHVEHMRLARLAMKLTWQGGDVRQTTLHMVRTAAAGDLEAALEVAHSIQAMVEAEYRQAQAAVVALQRWVDGAPNPPLPNGKPSLSIGETAAHLRVTRDMLYNWERNGLLEVPRDPATGYRAYGPAEISRLRVIRALRKGKYSMMAILTMLKRLDAGVGREDVRQVVDMPEEDAIVITDRWLTAISEIRGVPAAMIAVLQALG